MAAICAATPLTLANQLPFPTIVQVAAIASVSSDIEEFDLTFTFTNRSECVCCSYATVYELQNVGFGGPLPYLY